MATNEEIQKTAAFVFAAQILGQMGKAAKNLQRIEGDGGNAAAVAVQLFLGDRMLRNVEIYRPEVVALVKALHDAYDDLEKKLEKRTGLIVVPR